jgi:large subunit ribosomal protein L25
VSEVRIAAEPRTEFGKGAARRVRRTGRVPAVVYGHGAEPVHVSLPGHALMLALKTRNALLSLETEGGETQLVIPKAVQRDVLKGSLEHVDLLVVKRGEKVTVEVSIQTEGELAPGAHLLEYLINSLPVEAEATNIPETVTADISGLSAPASVLAKDLKLPAGTVLAIDGDEVVLQVTAAQAEEVAAEEAPAGAEA